VKNILLGLLFSGNLVACGVASHEEGAEPATDEQGDVNPDEAVGSIEQRVQVGTAGFFNIDTNNFKQKVTGTILLPWTSDFSVWTTCGATFISKHVAVTAAHCVPQNKVPHNTTSFFVQNYNVDELALRIIFGDTALNAKFQQAQTVTANGPFPNWTVGARLTEADGYKFTESGALGCAAIVRCSRTFGQELCPQNILDMNGGEGVDIALIHCPTRPTSRPWTTVFTGDETTGMAVEAHWAHEVLKLSIEPNDGIGPVNNFTNYGNYPGGDDGKMNNFHYRGFFTHQLFPLISRRFPNNGPLYTTTASLSHGNTERFTNVFGCHGTSGSGMFPQNSDRVLGPVVHGHPNGWGNSRLCTPPSSLGTNTDNLTFVRPFITRQLESMIGNDR